MIIVYKELPECYIPDVFWERGTETVEFIQRFGLDQFAEAQAELKRMED